MQQQAQSLPQWGFAPFLQALQQQHLWYETSILEGPAHATIRWGDKELVNFAGISFLGFQEDEEVLEHFVAATRRYGMVTGGSRLVQGICQAHQQVEELFCRVTGKERALTFASGLLANLGFLHAMGARFGKGGLCALDNSDTIFVLDQECHWSLRKGVERFPLNQQRFYFQHNDPAHLKKVLAGLRGAKVVVAFESLYTADGGIAPIGALLDVCEQYGAISYVDDANGFFIYGPAHRPFAQEFAQLARATFLMVSFSKAIGLEGGIIAGPAEAIRAFDFLSGTSIFTAALQPPTASTVHFIMRKLLKQPFLVDDYLERTLAFRAKLEQIGCQLNQAPTYTISILVGEDEKVEPVRRELLDMGYLVAVLHYPVVRFNQAMIRILPNTRHTDEHIDQFLDALRTIKQKYAF